MSAYNTAIDKSLDLTTSPVEICPVNVARRFLMVQNVGESPVGISIQGDIPSVNALGVGTAGTLVLKPGDGFILDTFPMPTNAIIAMCAFGDCPLTVIEW